MGLIRTGTFSAFFLFSTFALAQSKIVFMNEASNASGVTERHIMQANGDGSKAEFLTKGNDWHLYPDISANGEWVAYVQGAAQESLELVLQNLKTNELEQWTTAKGLVLHPDISGGGEYLAFSGPFGPKEENRIAIVDLKESRKNIKPAKVGDRLVYDLKPELITSDGNAFFPALSSDGSFVVYELSKPGMRKILLYDRGADKTTDITDGTLPSMAPALSFDDRYIAYTQKITAADKTANWDIQLLDRKTNTTTRLTSDPANDFAPNFEPDGSIVYASDKSGEFQLYRISIDEIRNKTFKSVSLVALRGASLYAPAVSGNVSYAQRKVTEVPDPARSSFGLTRVGDRIYVVGGHQGHEHTYPKESFLDNLEYYDLKTQTWGKAAPRPQPCHGYNVAVKGKYIYAFGGFAFSENHKPEWKSIDRIDRYDTEKDEWVLIGKLPRNRSSNVVATVRDKVYLIGGWDATPKSKGDLEGTFLREIDVFDLNTEKVTTLAKGIPDPLRRAFTSIVQGDDIYLVGGLGQGASHFDLLDSVTVYNPVTDTWRELERMPFATFAPAAGILNGKLHVFGGMFKISKFDYQYVNHIFELPLDGKSWRHSGRYLSETKGFSMVIPENDKSLLVVGGHSYFIGSDGKPTDGPIKTVESLELN